MLPAVDPAQAAAVDLAQMEPITCRVFDGVVVPIPTLPLQAMRICLNYLKKI
jgi:hypothetical protein